MNTTTYMLPPSQFICRRSDSSVPIYLSLATRVVLVVAVPQRTTHCRPRQALSLPSPLPASHGSFTHHEKKASSSPSSSASSPISADPQACRHGRPPATPLRQHGLAPGHASRERGLLLCATPPRLYGSALRLPPPTTPRPCILRQLTGAGSTGPSSTRHRRGADDHPKAQGPSTVVDPTRRGTPLVLSANVADYIGCVLRTCY